MTREEFFKTLKQVSKKHPFHLNVGYQLRTIDKGICPLCAVARKVLKKKFENHHYDLVQKSLHLDAQVVAEVLVIADNYLNFLYYPETRQQIVNACFPQEVTS